MVLNPAGFLTSRGLNQDQNAEALQTEKQEAWNPKYKKKNQKQNKNTKHKPQNKQNCADTRFWLIYFAFFVFFLVNLHIECFLVIWCVLIVLFFCFSVFVEVKFLCWNRCHSSRSNERNRVCIQPNPAISNHIYPRYNHIYPPHMYSQDGGACPPILSYILTFLFLLIGTILYIRRFCCSIVERDIQKELNRLLCESNQIQLFPSMPKV